MTRYLELSPDYRIVNGIRARREELHFTLSAVAVELGINKGELSSIETGRRVPTHDELHALIAALTVPPGRSIYPTLEVPDGEIPVMRIGRSRREQPAPGPERRRGPGETQTGLLLEFLRERGMDGVTPLDALEVVGSFRLGARVYDLRRRGYNITTEPAITPGGARVARYVLHEETTKP